MNKHSSGRASLALMALMALMTVVTLGCDSTEVTAETLEASAKLSRDALLDPETCKTCHPKHYREWASSMHAYAAEDPVFLAMNRRGQRETAGALGDFCVRCHAPMALQEGATVDGLNLDEVPPHLRGVTCYFCHNVVHVDDLFNNGLQLADDTTMRGGIADPVTSPAHNSKHSPLQDRNHGESSRLCGSCHDILTHNGVHLERTFAEYEGSLFATQGPGFDTCSGCHMPALPDSVANTPDAEAAAGRQRHEHLWPGVDTALTPFPDRELQRRAVECELALGTRIYEVRKDGLGGLEVRLETAAGHNQPSGSSLDRRLWLELIAYDAAGEVVFESGRIEDHEVVQKEVGQTGFDPQLSVFRDWAYDAEGQEVHMFWEAAPSPTYPDGYAALTLPAPIAPGMPHTLTARYQIPAFSEVARITARLRMRAVGLDVLQDLVDSGDLDAALLAEMPTWTVHGAAMEYEPTTGESKPLWPEDLRCPDHYRTLLHTQR